MCHVILSHFILTSCFVCGWNKTKFKQLQQFALIWTQVGLRCHNTLRTQQWITVDAKTHPTLLSVWAYTKTNLFNTISLARFAWKLCRIREFCGFNKVMVAVREMNIRGLKAFQFLMVMWWIHRHKTALQGWINGSEEICSWAKIETLHVLCW